MNRVMPPSTGSSYTMSARSRPACGRASGSVLDLDRQGRPVAGPRRPARPAPVSGQIGGGGVVGTASGLVERLLDRGGRVAGEGERSDATAPVTATRAGHEDDEPSTSRQATDGTSWRIVGG